MRGIKRRIPIADTSMPEVELLAGSQTRFQAECCQNGRQKKSNMVARTMTLRQSH